MSVASAAPALIGTLDEVRFDNRFTAALPADPETSNMRRQVMGACYSRVDPTPAPAPHLLAHSAEMFDLLGFDAGLVNDPGFAAVFAGSRLLDGMDPHAHCYGGHQFGNWAGQLGDGRAIALGEMVDRNGQHQTLQLKVRDRPRIRARPMVSPCCAARCASSSAARPWRTSACPPPGRSASWGPATWSCATCSMTATLRQSRGRWCAAWRPRSFDSATSRSSLRAARSRRCVRSPTSSSMPTSPTWRPKGRRIATCGFSTRSSERLRTWCANGCASVSSTV